MTPEELEKLSDKNIEDYTPMISSRELKKTLPLTEKAAFTVRKGRSELERILAGIDYRKIFIIGPCSVHDSDEAIEYAHSLKEISAQVEDRILIVMRAYLEKPRTEGDTWEGMIYDPYLDNTRDINYGLYKARKLLLDLNEIGLPIATEFMGVLTPQYIDDLVSWAAIGARTTESPLHKKMASGLSMPVGFKNNTSGEAISAVKAAKASTLPQTFVGVNSDGISSIVRTRGNPYTHIVLRGGNGHPNYNPERVYESIVLMQKHGLEPNIIVDCSHGNTNKDWTLQPDVLHSVVEQMASGNTHLVGTMMESYHLDGNQPLGPDPSTLRRGLSITDGCIGLEATREHICWAYDALGRSQTR
jgi:3-deoxy-7-phosphoheptulonate synthase